jgi:hypothetical protein
MTGWGGIDMRPTRWTLRVFGIAATLAFGLCTTPAHAACTTDPCAGGGSANFDCDRDGLTDFEECNGLVIGGTLYPRCGTGACLEPRIADLFVKFEKATPSAYTELGITDAAAFEYITQPAAAGGLAMRVHVLPATVVLPSLPQPNAITPRMAALVVREARGAPTACPVTSPLGLINGSASVNGAGIAQIFTQRIIDHVGCVYGTANANSPAAIEDKIKMIKHTTAHEATHANRLAPESVERFGGHHYKTGSGCVMDQSTTYSTKGGRVTFNTATAYCGPDQASVSAGETALGPIQCEDPNDVLDLDRFTIGCLPATP